MVLNHAGTGVESGKQEPALGFGDGASKFPRGFQPLGDHGLGVGKGFLPGDAIGCTASQLRHLGDKRLSALRVREVSYGCTMPSLAAARLIARSAVQRLHPESNAAVSR